MGKRGYLLVNFGGPRNLEEIEEFLIALLTDREVIRTPLPAFFHRLLFTFVAKRRSKKIAPDYAAIGGKSPIFEDTEQMARDVGKKLDAEVLTFHRYLPKTHASFIERIEKLFGVEEIRVVPMFPQFSYTTTGSIALWFSKHLSLKTVNKMQWVKSYPAHPLYIRSMQQCLREFLNEKDLKEEETVLLFSAHGLPQRYICTGDVYQKECRLSFEILKAHFPECESLLSYQSQFGKEPWIRPYTLEVCAEMHRFADLRKNVVIIPLSFTSDHIETLYEIEKLYLEPIRQKGFQAFRCPALNHRADWTAAVARLFQIEEGLGNGMLIRKETPKCCASPAFCQNLFDEDGAHSVVDQNAHEGACRECDHP